MVLPDQVRQSIEIAIAQMNKDAHHNLLFKQRLPIYKAIKEIDLTLGQKVQGWLAVLTARKVLPIWEREYLPKHHFEERIQLAENLLRDRLTFKELEETQSSLLPRLGIGLGENGWDYSDEANYAFICPDLALAEAMGDFLYKRDNPNIVALTEQSIEIGIPDEMMAQGCDIDTASAAVCAYSGISFNWDIINNMSHDDLADKQKVLSVVNNTFAPNFKPEKRKEFWLWWLGEAIPQAWELAGVNY